MTRKPDYNGNISKLNKSSRKYKCHYCKQHIEEDIFYDHKDRRCHKSCNDDFQKTNEIRNAVNKLLCDIFDIPFPTSQMLKYFSDKVKQNYPYEVLLDTVRLSEQSMIYHKEKMWAYHIRILDGNLVKAYQEYKEKLNRLEKVKRLKNIEQEEQEIVVIKTETISKKKKKTLDISAI